MSSFSLRVTIVSFASLLRISYEKWVSSTYIIKHSKKSKVKKKLLSKISITKTAIHSDTVTSGYQGGGVGMVVGGGKEG